MDRTVDRDDIETELEDAVVRGERFRFELVEHTGGDPLVTASPQGGVGHFEVQDRLDIDPGRSGHEPDQDPPEADLIGDARVVAAQRVRVVDHRSNGSTVSQITRT